MLYSALIDWAAGRQKTGSRCKTGLWDVPKQGEPAVEAE
jgi:hypothetical protein